MSGNPPHFVLLTRPQAASERFAKQLRGAFAPLEITIAPLQRIEPLPLSIEVTSRDQLIFTSAAGVDAFTAPAHTRPRIAWCVGPRTADAARAAGFDVRMGGGTAEALVAELNAAQPSARLVHLHGRHVTGDVAGQLRDAGLEAQSAAVYDQETVRPGPDFIGAFSPPRPVSVPLFSPRSAQLFFDAATPLDVSQASVFALSDAVAKVARTYHTGHVFVSESPTAPALIRAMTEVFLA